MRSRIFTIILAFIALYLPSNATSGTNTHMADTTYRSSINESYLYQNHQIRSFDYDSQIKKEKILSLANNVRSLSIISAFAACAITLRLTDNWSDWISVPLCGIVTIAAPLGIVAISEKIEKKAENIEVANLYEHKLNDTYAIAICNHYDRLLRTNNPGIALRVSF